METAGVKVRKCEREARNLKHQMRSHEKGSAPRGIGRKRPCVTSIHAAATQLGREDRFGYNHVATT